MFGWLAKAFGNVGTVRFEAKNADDTYTGTMEIEAFNVGNEEIEAEIKNMLWVRKGIRVNSVKIIGYSGT